MASRDRIYLLIDLVACFFSLLTCVALPQLDDRDWNALMSNKTMYFHVLLEAE